MTTDRLPQIFLQITDPKLKGKWKVIEGLCIVARNPSLHPGDVRVVVAVDVPELHHLRNCVVFPQTGDRDIPSMLSGGDLDGDDFLVMWDRGGIPKEWNQSPMDYSAPKPQTITRSVSVDDMTAFFVQHMRFDNLGPIAVAHRYWADFKDDGVKDPICLQLAELHSTAVDFQKTGRHAEMGKHLRMGRFPHWSEQDRRPMYTSRKILGKLYDEVQREPFDPAWEMAFDDRILTASAIDDIPTGEIRLIKDDYDAAVRRLMVKFGIQSEFEIWTTFVLRHGDEFGDYKLAESIGEAVGALKDHFQERCYESAGTSRGERRREKMDPFIAAMYAFTAEQVRHGLLQYKAAEKPQDEDKARQHKLGFMPLMSFPWIFAEDLGRIAKKQDNLAPATLPVIARSMKHMVAHAHKTIVSDEFFELAQLPAVITEQGEVSGGDLLDLFHKDDGIARIDEPQATPMLQVSIDQSPFRAADDRSTVDLPCWATEDPFSKCVPSKSSPLVGVALSEVASNPSDELVPRCETIASRSASSVHTTLHRSDGALLTASTSPSLLQWSHSNSLVCPDTAAVFSAPPGESSIGRESGTLHGGQDVGSEQNQVDKGNENIDGNEADEVSMIPMPSSNAMARLDVLLGI